jgi:hypothetical protein
MSSIRSLVISWSGAAALMAAAFALAWHTTRDLEWPNEYDLYRELASAQSLLREGFGRDPCYLGEQIWYNPLTHLAIAAFHRVSGMELHVAAARGGTYLNLFGPLAFFLMALRLLGRRRAIMALASYLFCIGGAFPSWAAATYSPWIYPVNFAQGFFYLLVFQLAALRDRTPGPVWSCVTGVLWGLCFLAHTAPALLFAPILALLAVRRMREAPSRPWRAGLVPALLVFACFTLVIAPFAASIVGHYGLRILNSVPNGYVADFLGYRKIPLMIARHLEAPVLVAWCGLVFLWRRRAAPFVRTLLLAWFALTAAYVGYGYVVAGFAKVGVRLPLIIPSFHALFYFKAALSLLFAFGLDKLSREVVARWRPEWPLFRQVTWAHRIALAGTAILVLIALPRYLDRYDYQRARAEAVGHDLERERIALYHWVLSHAGPRDVFLASDDPALFAIAPAGAKVIAVNPYLSNPYVEWTRRDAARTAMWDALAAGQGETFIQLARAWNVSHVLDETAGRGIAPELRGALLEEAWSSGSWRVYRIRF